MSQDFIKNMKDPDEKSQTNPDLSDDELRSIFKQLSSKDKRKVVDFASKKLEAQDQKEKWHNLSQETRTLVEKLLNASDLSGSVEDNNTLKASDFKALCTCIEDVSKRIDAKTPKTPVSQRARRQRKCAWLFSSKHGTSGIGSSSTEPLPKETVASELLARSLFPETGAMSSEAEELISSLCTRLRARQELFKYKRLDEIFQTMTLYNRSFHKMRKSQLWHEVPNRGDGEPEQPASLCQGHTDSQGQLEALFEAAEVIQPFVTALCTDLNLYSGVVFTRMGPLKQWQRAWQKVKSDYGGNAKRIIDLVRCSVICESLEALVAVIGMLDTKDGLTICRIKSGFASHMAVGYSGYRDVKVNAAFNRPNPLVFEIQLQLREFYLINRELGHELFAWARRFSPWTIASPEEILIHDAAISAEMVTYATMMLRDKEEQSGEHSYSAQKARLLLVEVLLQQGEEDTLRDTCEQHARELLAHAPKLGQGSELMALHTSRAYLAYGTLLARLGSHEAARQALMDGLNHAQAAHDILMVARMHHEIGNICSAEDDYNHALQEYRLAAEQSAEALGADHPGTAVSRICAAEALARSGLILADQGAAEELQTLRLACEKVEQFCGSRHPYLAKGYEVQSVVCRELGKHEEAKKAAELAVSIRQETCGHAAIQTAEAHRELALAAWGTGDHDLAKKQFKLARDCAGTFDGSVLQARIDDEMRALLQVTDSDSDSKSEEPESQKSEDEDQIGNSLHPLKRSPTNSPKGSKSLSGSLSKAEVDPTSSMQLFFPQEVVSAEKAYHRPPAVITQPDEDGSRQPSKHGDEDGSRKPSKHVQIDSPSPPLEILSPSSPSNSKSLKTSRNRRQTTLTLPPAMLSGKSFHSEGSSRSTSRHQTALSQSLRPEIVKDDIANAAVEEFKGFLESHGVDHAIWGQEGLESLHETLQKDAAYFERLIDGSSLTYVVPTLVLTLRSNTRPECFLQEVDRVSAGGASAGLAKPKQQQPTKPAIRLLRKETVRDAAARFVQERLVESLAGGESVEVLDMLLSSATTESHATKSRSYPGLETKYVRTFLEVVTSGLPDEDFTSEARRMDRCRKYRWAQDDSVDVDAYSKASDSKAREAVETKAEAAPSSFSRATSRVRNAKWIVKSTSSLRKLIWRVQKVRWLSTAMSNMHGGTASISQHLRAGKSNTFLTAVVSVAVGVALTTAKNRFFPES